MAIRRRIETELRPLGLTPQQSQALHLLEMTPGATNADMEEQLFIDKSSVTSLVNGMAKRGWVVRRDHAKDARRKQIYLTEQGRDLYKQCSAAVNRAKAPANEQLTLEESRTLQALLSKILSSYE
ncbi:MarR family transcriptional regulator [Paenibacillus sp. N4]|nr:MarR family transcriptional regulator [Paenibacillus vietnamensis]